MIRLHNSFSVIPVKNDQNWIANNFAVIYHEGFLSSGFLHPYQQEWSRAMKNTPYLIDSFPSSVLSVHTNQIDLFKGSFPHPVKNAHPRATNPLFVLWALQSLPYYLPWRVQLTPAAEGKGFFPSFFSRKFRTSVISSCCKSTAIRKMTMKNEDGAVWIWRRNNHCCKW